MTALTGVEIWANGTKPDLRAVWSALQTAGAIAYTSELHALEDGRHRLYLRLNAAVRPAPTTTTAAQEPALPLAS